MVAACGKPTASSTLEVKMSEAWLTIGELAKATGVATSTLRYWDEVGLLAPGARVSGQRRYPESAVELAGRILVLQDAGFRLRELRAFLAARADGPGGWREVAVSKLAELDDRIARAQAARTAVAHLLACPRQGSPTCPTYAGVVAARLAGTPLHEAHRH
jgi:DNA-binding transcriptional MerR regulator